MGPARDIEPVRYDDVPDAACWKGFLSSVAVAAGRLPPPAGPADADLYEDLGLPIPRNEDGAFVPLQPHEIPFGVPWTAATRRGGAVSGGIVVVDADGKHAMALLEYPRRADEADDPCGPAAADFLALRAIRRAGGRALSFIARNNAARIAVLIPVGKAIESFPDAGAEGFRRWILDAVGGRTTKDKPLSRRGKRATATRKKETA